MQRGGTRGWPAANIRPQNSMPVMQISPDDHNAAPITSGQAQAIHGNVVDAIAGAEAAATGARGAVTSNTNLVAILAQQADGHE